MTGEEKGDDVAEKVLDFGDAAPSSLSLTTKEKIDLGTHNLRVIVALLTLVAFILVNGAVLYGLHEALEFDFASIAAKIPNYQRFIDTTVITSILGATTIQLGAIMYTITKFLFPNSTS